jgi:hypothetical protein
MVMTNVCDHERKQYFVHTRTPISLQLFFKVMDTSPTSRASWAITIEMSWGVCFFGLLFATETPKIKPTRAFCVKMSTRLCILLLWKPINYRSLKEITSVITTTATSKPVNPHINQSRNCNIVTWLYQMLTSLKAYTVLFYSTMETLACITVYFVC